MGNSSNPADLCELLCREQQRRWDCGDRTLVETLVAEFPELSSQSQLLLDVIYGEYLLRRRLGESPTLSEYTQRFPDLSQRLERLFQIDELFGHDLEEFALGYSQGTAGLDSSTQAACSSCGDEFLASSNAEQLCRLCHTDAHPKPELLPGAEFSGFRLQRLIGLGQFGEVWLADDLTLNREVALKFPRLEHLKQKHLDTLLAEARTTARLRHPAIVPIYEIKLDAARPFLVTAYIPGQSLKQRIHSGHKIPQRQAVQICRQVALAVEHAHQNGVIHRDLKPANILIDAAGDAHVTDFGLAYLLKPESKLDESTDASGRAVGTPAYMSPEQSLGKTLDGRSDVYALGVVLYELLAGQRPFDGSLLSLTRKRLSQQPTGPSQLQADVPQGLNAICLKAMARSRMQRYASCAELAEDLQNWLEDRPVKAHVPTVAQRIKRWGRMHRRAIAGGGIAALLLLLVGVNWNRAVAVVSDAKWSGQRAMQSSAGIATVVEQAVRLTTNRESADLTLIPLDPTSGELIFERKISGLKSPARLTLPAGEYLVVAVADNGDFHEVYRLVPKRSEDLARPYRHQSWLVRADGTLDLPKIHIPTAEETSGMAFFNAVSEFPVGGENSPLAPRHLRDIPAFYLDTTEVTRADFQNKNISVDTIQRDLLNSDPLDFPATGISYHRAVAFAEMLGKRLPTEMELERATRQQSNTPLVQPEEMCLPMPVDSTPAVTADNGLLVHGLNTNVAEWTSSPGLPYSNTPFYNEQSLRNADYRIVRGGRPESTFQRQLSQRPAGDTGVAVYDRVSMARNTFLPGVGFRLARSSKPRLEPEDFDQAVAR